MNKRILGNTGIELTELGYGCASLFGKPSFVSDKEAMDLVYEAYEQGIRFFDTGHSYGVAEKRLGMCVKEFGDNERKNFVISTKCGTRISNQGKIYKDWSIEWLKRSVYLSLKRLNVDYIDMVQLHSPTIDVLTDELLCFLQSLKSSGIVKAIGISNATDEVYHFICGKGMFDFVMLEYNLLKRDREPLIKKMNENGIGILAGSSLAHTLFSNRVFKVRNAKDIWYLLRALKNFREGMINGRKFQFLQKVEGYSENQLALRYVLDNQYVTSALFGTVNMEHLVENIGATTITIPESVKNSLLYIDSDRSRLDNKA